MTLGLQIDGLSVRTARGRVLLEVPELQLAPGTLLGIRGPSGAGKSTLLHALSGLLGIASGQVRWGETEILGLGPEARAQFRAAHMGMIFQDFLLFDELSPLANAALAGLFARPDRRRGITEAANDRLVRLGVPDGARTVATFSGGERQRVAVARALATDPAVLLADEPTASLDRGAADRLIDDLDRVTRAQSRTMVAVSHDLRLLDRMDRVLTIEDGRIARDEARAA